MPAYVYECVGAAPGSGSASVPLAGQEVEIGNEKHRARFTVDRKLTEPEIVPTCAICGELMRRVYEAPVIRINWRNGR